MKEEKRLIEDFKNNNGINKKYESFRECLPQDLNKQNEKLIKLIRQKKYPLHFSHRSALLFPKIKQKVNVKKKTDTRLKKTYIEIQLDDEEESKLLSKYKTVIEEEMMLRMRLNDKEKRQKLKKGKDTVIDLLSKYQRKHQLCSKKKSRYRVSHFQSNHQVIQSATDSIMFQQNGQNAQFLKSEGLRIMTEQVNHQSFLRKIKEQIHKQRNLYINEINLTELIDKPVNKQKFSIEYLVKSLDSKQKRDSLNNCSLVGYEDVSPNKLGKFMSMFSKSHQKKPTLDQELKSFQEEKQKVSNENSKSMKMFRKMNRNKTTILQQENDIEIENIISAKYRMKTNHKKLIEIARSKPNQ